MNKFLFNKKTLYISLALVPLSFVIGLGIVKKWGFDFTLLGPYGDFFAGTTVPILTFISFLAVIITINQQQEQLKTQKQEIQKNIDKAYQEALPEKIINLEESIELIESHVRILRQIVMDTYPPEDVPFHKLKLRMLEFKDDIIFQSKYSMEEKFNQDHKIIKSNLVKVNATTYKAFREFIKKGNSDYHKIIRPILEEFINFRSDITNKYEDELEFNVELNTNIIQSDILKEEDKEIYRQLKERLFFVDMKYFQSTLDNHNEIILELEKQLEKYIKDLK